MRKEVLSLLLLMMYAIMTYGQVHITYNSYNPDPDLRNHDIEKTGRLFKSLDFAKVDTGALDKDGMIFYDVLTQVLHGDSDILELLDEVIETGTSPQHSFYEYLFSEFCTMYDACPRDRASGVSEFFHDFPAETVIALDTDKKIKYHRGPHGHLYVPVSIGRTKENMILDTGADWTLLSKSKAEAFGVKLGNEIIDLSTSTSNTVQARFGYIPMLIFGNVKVKNHRVLVVDDAATQLTKEDEEIVIDAILGWNLLRHLRLEIDDSNFELLATFSKSRDGNQDNLFWMGYPGVVTHDPMTGQRLLFGLDTGSSITEISPPFIEWFSRYDYSQDTVSVGGMGGTEYRQVEITTDVQIAIENNIITFDTIQSNPQRELVYLDQAGILGIDLLHDNVMIIDFKNHTFSIDRPE